VIAVPESAELLPNGLNAASVINEVTFFGAANEAGLAA
jgi:hypothetical protein